MNELTHVRPLELIEAEINFYKAQTANGIIETGKRLLEAQGLLGEEENFTTWLKEKVDFSRRTAYNFIRVAKEFDDVQSLARLGQTKVFQLLEIPSEDRQEFMETNNLEEMTTRQVNDAVKQWKQIADDKSEEAQTLLKEKQKVESELNTANQDLKTAQADVEILQYNVKTEKLFSEEKENELAAKCNEVQTLKQELSQAKKKGDSAKVKELGEKLSRYQKDIDDLEKTLKSVNKQITELTEEKKSLINQLHEKPIEATTTETIEVIPEETQRELEDLRKKAALAGSTATLKYKVYFDDLVETFKKLLGTLEEIKAMDQGTFGKYRTATVKLVGKLESSIPADVEIEQEAPSESEIAQQEAAATNEANPDANCGICTHADMKGVSDEELDGNKTWCTESNEIVDFKHCCSKFDDVRKL